ncbi:L,D-transpeptidase family protein [Methylomarinum sp. Ch1-1]|uniref:L,D-transpeptidase family protein n=1 Tax=Methylomarinum roseum TaxID=3067653 RepID=A0AAU7NWJ7_9GAMM|nr:L,D-transpeptidase family protein [Methylomarinum sp. Ch1-1]MDP4523038.1 L,D-transpeptidase family protein [Methylomarinum sp. Ch1-1]
MNNKLMALIIRGKLLLICCLLISTQTLALSRPKIQQARLALDEAVQVVLAGTGHPYLSRPDFNILRQPLKELYFLAPYSLLWLKADDFEGHVPEVLKLLETAPESGLRMADYDVDRLKKEWLALRGQKVVNADDLALFDTALSIATMRYLDDLQRGRIGEQSIRFGFKPSSDVETLVSLLIKAVQSRQIHQLAEWIEPDYKNYRQLKKALARYRALARQYRFPTLLFQGSLREGDRDPQLPLLRRKLAVLGLLGEEVHEDSQGESYDRRLLMAVKHFQRLHGLTDDGVIGAKTLAALNTPLIERVRQIELALERMRWLPRLNKEQALILVNIPAFRLCAYRPGNVLDHCDLSMKVVVGIASKNQTPVFMADLLYLEFRPYWNVPKNITAKEILPKVRENPDYLLKQNMELVQYFGKHAQPQAFSQASLTLLEDGKLKVRQRPGPKNALGLIKFIFPNRYSVYLHDTPAKKLFTYQRRDFSHGCIRVEQPKALAEFVLGSHQEWQAKHIGAAMLNDESQRVIVNDSIAVLVFYSTAQVIGDEVYFFDDIYGYDQQLILALRD